MKKNSTEIKKSAAVLGNLISKEGYDYIYENPFRVYKTLLKEEIDNSVAAALLYALVSNTARNNKDDIESEVGNTLSLNKEMSEVLTAVFSAIYNSDSLSEMKTKEYKGLEEFINGEWELESGGEATWEYKRGGSKTDYSYTYSIVVHVVDRTLVEKDLKDKLKKNPFLTAEDIRLYYEDKFDSLIGSKFYDYCTCDDYYPPVVEDFQSECPYYLKKFLPEHGLEMTQDEEYYDCHESDIYR